MTFTRREAIQTLGALAAARMLPGCGQNPPGTIDTMVFLLMENRSYDHYLGARGLVEGKPGDGLVAGMANPNHDGASIAIAPTADDAMCVPSPPHSWDPARVQFDGGGNDGFVRAYQDSYPGNSGATAMTYMTRADLPVHYALADAYTSCDRWFSSLLGPTLPNRMYWHAATANGAKNNDDVLNGAYKGLTTIYHRLNDASIDWAYYYNDVPVLAALGGGTDITGKLRRFNNQFLDDAEAGKLPPVVYIDPGFTTNDDHPPHHPLLGQQLIAATYNALATSPQWPRCLLVISYDEHGGFYDHVAPGTAPDDRAADGFNQLGFRVPALVVGPYARAGHVSSVTREHTSCLRHIEKVFSLEPLTMRDAAANDLSECIDAERLAAGEPAAPIQLPAVEVDESMLPASCNAGAQLGKPDHDLVEWADANPGKLGSLDRRRYGRDDVFAIAEYLDRFGLGRIRKGR